MNTVCVLLFPGLSQVAGNWVAGTQPTVPSTLLHMYAMTRVLLHMHAMTRVLLHMHAMTRKINKNNTNTKESIHIFKADELKCFCLFVCLFVVVTGEVA